MGFNRCILKGIENLQKEFETIGLESFVKKYNKYEAIAGPSESFRFLDEKRKEYGIQQILKNVN